MTTIHFKNGSTIEVAETTGENVRSKRGEEQIQLIKEYYSKPWLLLGGLYKEMPWYWKLKIRIACKFDDIKKRWFK